MYVCKWLCLSLTWVEDATITLLLSHIIVFPCENGIVCTSFWLSKLITSIFFGKMAIMKLLQTPISKGCEVKGIGFLFVALPWVYVCMYVCIYVWMYVCIWVRIYYGIDMTCASIYMCGCHKCWRCIYNTHTYTYIQTKYDYTTQNRELNKSKIESLHWCQQICLSCYWQPIEPLLGLPIQHKAFCHPLVRLHQWPTYTYIYIHTYTHTSEVTTHIIHVCTHMNTHTYTYMHTYIHIQSNICIHTKRKTKLKYLSSCWSH